MATEKLPTRLPIYFRNLKGINSTLLADLSRAQGSTREAYSEVIRSRGDDHRQELLNYRLKTLIRCFLGGVDATAYCLREAVLDCASTIDKKERKTLRKVRNPRSSLKLGYSHFSRLFGLELDLDENSAGWMAFSNLVDTRNGFTHPKNIKDLFALKHLSSVQPALVWYPGVILELIEAAGETLGIKRHTDRFPETKPMPREGMENVEQIFDSEFFDLLGQDAGRSIRYLNHCFGKLNRETLQGVREASLGKSVVLTAVEQYTFRNLTRTLFSNIEGFANFFRLELEKASKRGEVKLDGTDRESMKTGRIEERAAATARIWSREVGYDRTPSTMGREWQSVIEARGLRNRITHPKELHDLRIDLKRAGLVLKGSEWFTSQIMGSVAINADKWIAKLGNDSV